MMDLERLLAVQDAFTQSIPSSGLLIQKPGCAIVLHIEGAALRPSS